MLIEPSDAAARREMACRGILGESVRFRSRDPVVSQYQGPWHLLVVIVQGVRHAGETMIDGLPPSGLRDVSSRMSLVPAGRSYRGEFASKVLPVASYIYLDPNGPLLDPELRFAERELAPRLLFQDAAIWATASKLRVLMEAWHDASRLYAEALACTLSIELLRLQDGRPLAAPASRGGLTARHQRLVCDYIEQHLAEDVSLADLAALSGLSASYFARAFKRSLGLPPHQYQLLRRIERAKELLANSALTVGEVAAACGFLYLSSFDEAFRRQVGVTPMQYRRALT